MDQNSLLKQIVADKKISVDARKGQRALKELRTRIDDADSTRGFAAALQPQNKRLPNLVAEVKKASPSKGIIRVDFEPVEIAQIYEDGGASALSVLTEEQYFLGHPDYLAAIRKKVSLPILQKDFMLDAFQIYEARALGADAILLIVALLSQNQLQDYFALAQELSLDVLIEVHTEAELECIIEWAPVIGINNRDLNTFETKLETTFRLVKDIPKDRTIVSESGIRTAAELEILVEAGVHAVLIGETLMASKNISEKMKSLFGS